MGNLALDIKNMDKITDTVVLEDVNLKDIFLCCLQHFLVINLHP